MIEVKERLYIEAEDFFKKIEESIVYDIQQSTGKKIISKDIKSGFSYTKKLKNKLGRKGDVKVTIIKFVSPMYYSAEFKSATGINRIHYIVEKIEEYCTDVTYKEEFVGSSNSADWNFKLMNFFYKRRAKKRAVRMIRAIEQYIRKN